ncbi:MHYT domain-containing protein [Rhodococcus rhodochrous]|uniref:MHYT domain-containing protein n=2 Tax=Rhodococcus rhodochrous TaxID=1829 RepID=UPI001CE3230D|nr:MHYT domain-containing protein [Rhodococcus rhodochrous]
MLLLGGSERAARVDTVGHAAAERECSGVPYARKTMTHEIHHFDLGLWVLFVAYGTSIAGSYVGLSCVRQAHTRPSRTARWAWLLLGALSLGGVGIWITHFIAMMGFSVPGSLIRYDPVLTALSAAVAVAATLFGLWLIDIRALSAGPLGRAIALSVGGVVMGLAVSLMHYSGRAAIRISGTLTHDSLFVMVSILIGIGASTAALWLARRAARLATRVLGAVIMGGAVAALHYTGMAGLHVDMSTEAPVPDGVPIMTLLLAAFAVGTLVLSAPLILLVFASRAGEAHLDEAVEQWVTDRHGDPATSWRHLDGEAGVRQGRRGGHYRFPTAPPRMRSTPSYSEDRH